MPKGKTKIEKKSQHILNSYSVGLPHLPDLFIYEYEDGRKELVEIDKEIGKVTFIGKFHSNIDDLKL